MSNVGINLVTKLSNRIGGIGAEDVNLASPIPEITENKTYQRFHKELWERKAPVEIETKAPMTIYSDPTDFHSVGLIKTTKQQAGRDYDHSDMGTQKIVDKMKYLNARFVGGKSNAPGCRKCKKMKLKM